jgi:hypothetical protein
MPFLDLLGNELGNALCNLRTGHRPSYLPVHACDYEFHAASILSALSIYCVAAG